MSKTIFITGANGFLGSRIAIIAKKRKYNVIALVRESSNLENSWKFFNQPVREIWWSRWKKIKTWRSNHSEAFDV